MKKRLTAMDLQALQGRVNDSRKWVKNIPENQEIIFQTWIVGIDPDVERCGMAWKKKGSSDIEEVLALPFFEVLNQLNNLKASCDVVVYLDAGWLISKSNWHDNQGSRRGEKIAKNVGACHQVGKLIAEYCRRKGIVCHLVKPTGSKIGAVAFAKMGLWQGRINQDCRDACLLIIGR
jgi:hypothetical protein